MTRAYYSGDVNAEYGGYFYTKENLQWNYSDVVRITPCSDAGGPDNCYWIEELVVSLPEDDATRATILQCVGRGLDEWKAQTPAAQAASMIDACLAYGKYDQHAAPMVRIGKPDPFWTSRGDRFDPDIVLRGNASIRRYARKQV